jgi:hypothetical protein
MRLLRHARAVLHALRDPGAPARRSFRFEALILADPDRIFPLLCPIREEEWIEGWSATVLFSASGVAEPGAVFRTRIETGELWVTTVHDRAAHRAEYVVVGGAHLVLLFQVSLEREPGEASRLIIVRTYTGLDAVGRGLVGELTDERVRADDERIARQLAHFLATGAMLRARGRDARP